MGDRGHTPARTAVPTGAARLIVAATARRLARDGMCVALLDLDGPRAAATAEHMAGLGGGAVGLSPGVGDEDTVRCPVAKVAERLGPPTVQVNNAGVLRDHLLSHRSTAEWDQVMSVHLRGASPPPPR